MDVSSMWTTDAKYQGMVKKNMDFVVRDDKVQLLDMIFNKYGSLVT